jgi:hypothetical protein
MSHGVLTMRRANRPASEGADAMPLLAYRSAMRSLVIASAIDPLKPGFCRFFVHPCPEMAVSGPIECRCSNAFISNAPPAL